VLGVGLAHESDVPALAALYCEAFRDLFQHIGLPAHSGPAVLESLWRSKGNLALARCTSHTHKTVMAYHITS
jgi:hypothetical protein